MAILHTARPFSAAAQPELTGGRRVGVLLSHGFTGSPDSMREWGQYLAGLGHAVQVPRLPGHGTTWQDMNTTTYDEWYAELDLAFRHLADSCDTVVVGGLSMGGSLALRLAADHRDEVAGVMLVNPGIVLKNPLVPLLPVLKHVLASVPGVGSDIKMPGVTESAYAKVPTKALHSMLQGWADLRPRLGSITAPVLYFHSTEDHVVDDASATLIRAGIRSDLSYVRLENSYHVATQDNDKEQIFAESAAFVARIAAL